MSRMKAMHCVSICRLIVLTIAAVDLVPSLQLDDIDPKDEDVNVENSGGDDGGGQKDFLQCLLGFLCTWFLAILVEGALVISSLRGTILEDELRWHSEYLLYIKLGKENSHTTCHYVRFSRYY